MLQAAPAPAASLRVLHVDDDPIEHAIVSRLLTRPSHAAGGLIELRQVRDVPAAVRALHERPFDVVLLDLNNGEAGTDDALDAILAQHLGVPVVVVTRQDPSRAIDAIARGAEDVLAKDDLDAGRLFSALTHAHARWRRTPTPFPSIPTTRRAPPRDPRAGVPEDALSVGTVLDRYVVEGVIGRGGSAVVYRVRHRALGSEHALKVVHGARSGDRRLLREGQAQARLRHPNLVMVTDVLELAGPTRGIGLVMEYVQGPTLLQWMRQGRSPAAPWIDVFRGIVRGVRHAHTIGLVHRDLKPANVLMQVVGDSIVPKVTDFGIAKAFAAEPEIDLAWSVEQPGLGTPGYMAPEQVLDAAAVDARADLFSLGCILYDLACGRSAFRGPDRKAILAVATRGIYAHPHRVVPDLPQRVVDVIEGLLAVDPRARIGDCDTLLRALDGVK